MGDEGAFGLTQFACLGRTPSEDEIKTADAAGLDSTACTWAVYQLPLQAEFRLAAPQKLERESCEQREAASSQVVMEPGHGSNATKHDIEVVSGLLSAQLSSTHLVLFPLLLLM
jgi:hypothetical protein